MSKEAVKVILWEENQKDFLKKFYDLEFIPRIGEEIYLKKENWIVTRVEHDIEPYNEKCRRGMHESMDFSICRPAPTEREHADVPHKSGKRKFDQVTPERSNSRVEISTTEDGRGNKRKRIDDQPTGVFRSVKKWGIHLSKYQLAVSLLIIIKSKWIPHSILMTGKS